MTRVRLEIDEIKIHRPKKRWKLYFVVIAEHPTDPGKMILTTLLNEPFKLSPRHENSFHFDAQSPGSEGLFVLSREMPPNRELNVHIYLRHTRQEARNLGGILKDLENGLAGQAFGTIVDVVGTTGVPWLVIAKEAIQLVGRILEEIPDRDFGFLSAFERFGSEFESLYEIDYEKPFTGDASIVYSWTVDQPQTDTDNPPV